MVGELSLSSGVLFCVETCNDCFVCCSADCCYFVRVAAVRFLFDINTLLGHVLTWEISFIFMFAPAPSCHFQLYCQQFVKPSISFMCQEKMTIIFLIVMHVSYYTTKCIKFFMAL